MIELLYAAFRFVRGSQNHSKAYVELLDAIDKLHEPAEETQPIPVIEDTQLDRLASMPDDWSYRYEASHVQAHGRKTWGKRFD